MISLTDSQQLVIDTVSMLEPIDLSIENAPDHTTAGDIISSVSVAPFRNSAMDGFAVVADRLTECPATMEISDTVFAGDEAPTDCDPSKALKIMTGAPVPEPYDSVVRFEDTHHDDNRVTINVAIQQGQNVRLPGEDIQRGDVLLTKGRIISPLAIGVLASIGLKTVPVVRKPRVLVMSTGDELVPVGQELRFGQIYDSNCHTIASLIRPFCAKIEKRDAVADNVGDLLTELSNDHEVIITSGGVSMGEKDFLPKVAEDCGWKPLFHKVAIKPGKPVYVATRGSQTLFGLPGNPLSAAVTCAVLVIPALKKMGGVANCLPEPFDARLNERSPIKSGRTVVWPGQITHDANGYVASLSNKRSSAALSALLGSDGLIFLYRDNPDDNPVIKVLPWQNILRA